VAGTPAPPRPASAIPRGGATEWIETGVGKLKTRVYASESLSAHPILVVFVHGDFPVPPPSYQYDFARTLAEGCAATSPLFAEEMKRRGYPPLDLRDVVAAGLLRPGFTDSEGDRSAGAIGSGTDEPQWTPAIVDAVAEAVGLAWPR